jgi:hypothetical protein
VGGGEEGGTRERGVYEAHRTQERELGRKGERVGHGEHGKKTYNRGKRDLGQGEGQGDEHGGQG